jgi:zinc transport system substrate-binding protein
MSVLRNCVLLGGLFLVFAACGDGESTSGQESLRYVTTIPPFEMILTPVVDGRATVDRLLEPGASPHTFDPTPSDVRAATESMALFLGAETLDGWAADLPASRHVALVDLVPRDHQLEFGAGGHGQEVGPTIDPHFWTDPTVVRRVLPVLVDTLCAIDSGGCSTYRANADSFATVLATLDTQIESIVRPIQDTPVFLAKPFFRYFLHRYGPQLTGIVEPQPGAEPTPRQLHRVVERARTSGAQAILTQQAVSSRPAQAVSESTTLPFVVLDPLGGTATRSTYTDLLLHSARVLRDSLAGAS